MKSTIYCRVTAYRDGGGFCHMPVDDFDIGIGLARSITERVSGCRVEILDGNYILAVFNSGVDAPTGAP